MTIKELFDKVDVYNEVAQKTYTREIEVKVNFDGLWSETFGTFDEFTRYLRKNVKQELAEQVLTCKHFDINSTTLVECESDECPWEVEVYVYERDGEYADMPTLQSAV